MNNATANKLHRIEQDTRRQWGDKTDISAIASCDPHLIDAYGNGYRLRVTRTYPNGGKWTRTGWVGITSGWAPALLLMKRSNSRSSWDVLGTDDVVEAIQHGKNYLPTNNARATTETREK